MIVVLFLFVFVESIALANGGGAAGSLLEILHRYSLKSSFLFKDHSCLPIQSTEHGEELSIFKSMKISAPHPGEMTTTKFQALMTGEVLNYEEAVRRNNELSLCYQLYLETPSSQHSNGVEWKAYYEECGLDIFGVNVLVGQHGKNRLVTTLFHQLNGLPPKLICQSEVEFNCCVSLNQSDTHGLQSTQDMVMSEIDFEHYLVEEYMKEMHQVLINSSEIDSINLVATNGRPAILKSPLMTYQVPPSSHSAVKYVRVLIGIKSFALNFKIRQAIRRTWFQAIRDMSFDQSSWLSSYRYRIDFFPYFIIGYSTIVDNWSNHRRSSSYPASKMSLRQTINAEQALFSDLLLSEELDGVEDTYFHLTQKVMAFFHWSNIEKLSKAELEKDDVFVIICDDDAYLNIQDIRYYVESLIDERETIRQKMKARESDEKLSTDEEADSSQPLELHPFYGGEILEMKMRHKFKPVRDEDHLHYLEESAFPFQELPPFALGNFYMLSADAVSYLAKNRDILQPIGTLEDLSVGFWLLSIHAFPTLLPGVCEVSRCSGDLTSFRAASVLSSPRNRFFAVAGLKQPESFDAVHEVIVVTFLDDSNPPQVVFDGHKRHIALESDIIVDTYYRNILNRLMEVEQNQQESNRLKLSTALQSSRRVNKLGRPVRSGNERKSRRKLMEEKATKKAIVQQFQKRNDEFTVLTNKATRYYFTDETGSDDAVWTPLTHRQTFLTTIPIRVVVFVRTLDISEAEIEAYRSLFLELSLNDNIDVEVVLGSRQGSVSFLELLANLVIPMRYFTPFDESLQENKDELWFQEQLPYQTLIARYFASFDFVVLPQRPGITGNGHFQLFYKLWTCLSQRFSNLQLEGNVVSSDISLPHLLEVTASSMGTINRGNDKAIDNVPLAHLRSHLLRTIQQQSIRKRMRSLSNAKLSEQTVLLPWISIVFGPGSLYLRQWLRDILRTFMPSHAQFLETRMYQFVKDQTSSNNGYILAKVVATKDTDDNANERQELHHLTRDDVEILQQQSSIIFATSFLDCAEQVQGNHEQRLMMKSPTSFACMNRLYQALSQYVGSTNVDSIRSMWFSGEAIVHSPFVHSNHHQNPVEELLGHFQKELPWLNIVFLPQSSPLATMERRQSPSLKVFYLPTFATSFPEFSEKLAPKLENIDEWNEDEFQRLKSLRPSRLLRPSPNSTRKVCSQDKLIAYLYFRCDRPDRETLFRSLYNVLRPSVSKLSISIGLGGTANGNIQQPSSKDSGIHALGACHGNVNPIPRPPQQKALTTDIALSSEQRSSLSREAFAQSRFKDGYNLDAVESYRDYAFVVAGENVALKGYITEKLTNALLAGAVPIYLGSKSVEMYFNSSAFIACYADEGQSLLSEQIDKCVQTVLAVTKDEKRWRQMLSAIPIAGKEEEDRIQNWLSIFYWHDDARDTVTAHDFGKTLRNLLVG